MESIERAGEVISNLQSKIWYEALFAILAVVSILTLLIEYTFNPSEATVGAFHIVDTTIALIMLADFLAGQFFARERLVYFKHNWFNFLSSIPLSEDVFRVFRILRLVRTARVIRIARVVGAVANAKESFEIANKIGKSQLKKRK